METDQRHFHCGAFWIEPVEAEKIVGQMTCSKEPQAESNQDTAGRAKPSVHGPAHSSK